MKRIGICLLILALLAGCSSYKEEFNEGMSQILGEVPEAAVRVEEIPIDSEIVINAMDIGFYLSGNMNASFRETDVERLCWADNTWFDYYFINDQVKAEEIPDNVKITIAWHHMGEPDGISAEAMEEMVKNIFGSSTTIEHQSGFKYGEPSYYEGRYYQPGLGGDGPFIFNPHYVFCKEKAELAGDKLNVYYRVGWLDGDYGQVYLYKKDHVTKLGEVGSYQAVYTDWGSYYHDMTISKDKLIEYMNQANLYKFEFVQEGDHYCFVGSERID